MTQIQYTGRTKSFEICFPLNRRDIWRQCSTPVLCLLWKRETLPKRALHTCLNKAKNSVPNSHFQCSKYNKIYPWYVLRADDSKNAKLIKRLKLEIQLRNESRLAKWVIVVMLFGCIVVLFYCCSVVILFVALLLCCFSCIVVLLYCCIVVLLYCICVVLLYCSFVVLSYCRFVVL